MVQQSKGKQVYDSMTTEQKTELYREFLYQKYKKLDDSSQRAFIMKGEQQGMFENLKNAGLDVLTKVGQQLDRIGGAVRAANQAGLTEIRKSLEQGRKIENLSAPAMEAFVKQLANPAGAKGAPSSEEIIETIVDISTVDIRKDPKYARVNETLKNRMREATLSKQFPGLFSETGEGVFTFQKGGPVDFSAMGTMGFVLDMAQDVPLPVGAAVKLTAKGATELAKGTAKLSANMVDVATRSGNAKAIMKALGETTDEFMERQRLFFSPKHAKDLPHLERIKKKFNIQSDMTDTGRFGKGSAASILEEKKGGLLAIKKADDLANEVNDAYSKELGKMSRGNVSNPTTAGEVIREAIDKKSAFIQNQDAITYSVVAKKNPNMILSKKAAINLKKNLEGLEKELLAKKRATNNASEIAQINEGLKDIADIRANPSYDFLNRKRMNAGKFGWQIGEKPVIGQVPGDKAFNRKLYKATSSALVDTINELPGGNSIVKNIKENNKALVEMFDGKFALKEALDKNKSAEQIYDRYIRRGNPKEIAHVKALLGPDSTQYGMVKATYLDDISQFESKTGAKSFSNVHKTMTNARTGKARYLLNDQEYADITDLMYFGHRNNVKIAPPSGESFISDLTGAITRQALERKAATGSFIGAKGPGVTRGALERTKELTRAQEAEESREARRKMGRVETISGLESLKEELQGLEKPGMNRSLVP